MLTEEFSKQEALSNVTSLGDCFLGLKALDAVSSIARTERGTGYKPVPLVSNQVVGF